MGIQSFIYVQCLLSWSVLYVLKAVEEPNLLIFFVSHEEYQGVKERCIALQQSSTA